MLEEINIDDITDKLMEMTENLGSGFVERKMSNDILALMAKKTVVLAWGEEHLLVTIFISAHKTSIYYGSERTFPLPIAISNLSGEISPKVAIATAEKDLNLLVELADQGFMEFNAAKRQGSNTAVN